MGADARPQSRARVGLTQIGLPYAQDAGITRHLAALLARQAQATRDLPGFTADSQAAFLCPSAILFNGGVFKGQVLAERCLQTINGWLQQANAAPARRLDGADLDLAVARGAAYYGYVKRGQGVRIRGGTAQAFYIGIESNMPAIPGFEPPLQALCVAPFGMEEGHALDLPGEELGLVVGEPVTFRFFASSVRRQDGIGQLLEGADADALEELPALQLSLPAGEGNPGQVVAVRLQALASEAGTLELAAVARDGRRWNIAFDVRQTQ